MGGPHYSLEWLTRSQDVYRLGIEVKGEGKGGGHYGRGALKDATAQVFRGMNGFVAFAMDRLKEGNRSLFTKDGTGRTYAAFMPVIFTTARLLVSSVDLSKADLQSGNVDVGGLQLEEKNWLLYQYAQSPDLKHSYRISSERHDIADMLYFDYTRTVLIVNAAGIQDFLSNSWWRHSEDWKGEE